MPAKVKKSYLCHKINVMKKSFLSLLCCLLLLAACTPKPESLIGTWTADKVNVEFDENRTTPELVRQMGEMEKGNSFSINADSILYFKGSEESFEGPIALSEDGTLYCGGKMFGQWKEGMIVTTVSSPLGEITVKYRKK